MLFRSGTSFTNMFDGSTIPTATYSALLVNWAGQTLSPSESFHGGSSLYYSGGDVEAARTSLINDDSWTIVDGGPGESENAAPTITINSMTLRT